MIYKFKCKATGDLVMLGANGDQLLRLLGREPAAKGIIEVGAMPLARRSLQAAVGAESPAANSGDDGSAGGGEPRVGLRQRMWPMLDMLERAERAGEPIVWGV